MPKDRKKKSLRDAFDEKLSKHAASVGEMIHQFIDRTFIDPESQDPKGAAIDYISHELKKNIWLRYKNKSVGW